MHRILARDVLRTVPEPPTVALIALRLVALATVSNRRGGLNNWRFWHWSVSFFADAPAVSIFQWFVSGKQGPSALRNAS